MKNLKLEEDKYQKNLDSFIEKEKIVSLEDNIKSQVKTLNQKDKKICFLNKDEKNDYCYKWKRKLNLPLGLFFLIFCLLIPFGLALFVIFYYSPSSFDDVNAFGIGKSGWYAIVVFVIIPLAGALAYGLYLSIVFFFAFYLNKKSNKDFIKFYEGNFDFLYFLIKNRLINLEKIPNELKFVFVMMPQKEFQKWNFISKIDQEFIDELFEKSTSKINLINNIEEYKKFLSEEYEKLIFLEKPDKNKDKIYRKKAFLKVSKYWLESFYDGYSYLKEIIKKMDSLV